MHSIIGAGLIVGTGIGIGDGVTCLQEKPSVLPSYALQRRNACESLSLSNEDSPFLTIGDGNVKPDISLMRQRSGCDEWR